MNVYINKDTQVYGSFSTSPGNNGCLFFNNAFKKHNINAIYKSFFSDDIELTIKSVRHLRFSGFALSMPHKISVIPFLDEMDDISTNIGAVNTVIVKDDRFIGYNTDYYGIDEFLSQRDIKNNINIIGTGGFSKTIQYVCNELNIRYTIFDRHNIHNIPTISNEVFINATPIEITSNISEVIDFRPHTYNGRMLALNQAKEQFKLYTGVSYE
jgi:shikimate 5-dehydrogenase